VGDYPPGSPGGSGGHTPGGYPGGYGGDAGGDAPPGTPLGTGGALRRTLSATLFDASVHFGIARSISAIRQVAFFDGHDDALVPGRMENLKKQDLTPILPGECQAAEVRTGAALPSARVREETSRNWQRSDGWLTR
jgi:hypothetical protein